MQSHEKAGSPIHRRVPRRIDDHDEVHLIEALLRCVKSHDEPQQIANDIVSRNITIGFVDVQHQSRGKSRADGVKVIKTGSIPFVCQDQEGFHEAGEDVFALDFPGGESVVKFHARHAHVGVYARVGDVVPGGVEAVVFDAAVGYQLRWLVRDGPVGQPTSRSDPEHANGFLENGNVDSGDVEAADFGHEGHACIKREHDMADAQGGDGRVCMLQSLDGYRYPHCWYIVEFEAGRLCPALLLRPLVKVTEYGRID